MEEKKIFNFNGIKKWPKRTISCSYQCNPRSKTFVLQATIDTYKGQLRPGRTTSKKFKKGQY